MPPAGVKKGTKRARQYEHVKESQLDEGKSESRAEEVAARTVNKERALGRVTRALEVLDERHLLEPPWRTALGHQPGEGAHPRPALQRGEEAQHRRPLEDEQGAAPARGRPQEVGCRAVEDQGGWRQAG